MSRYLRPAMTEDGSQRCFRSHLRPERILSDVTLTKVLRVNGLSGPGDGARVQDVIQDVDDGADERPWSVGESALAHQLGGSVEQAHARSDLFDRRGELMQQWADYLTT